MDEPYEEHRLRAAVRSAIASAKLEGQEVPPDWLLQAERYIRGDITIDEWISEVLANYRP